MLVLRYLYFAISRVQLKPTALVYMSPRGLISILLFIQLKEVTFIDSQNSPIDERVLLIIILSSMLVMLMGTLKKKTNSENEEPSETEGADNEPIDIDAADPLIENDTNTD